MNGKINQSPTSDESNSTLRWCADSTEQNVCVANRTKRSVTNFVKEDSQDCKLMFYLWRALESPSEHWNNAGGKFMQAHEPICKWCTQRDKELHHHDSARCNFDFYAPREVKNCSNAFYAFFPGACHCCAVVKNAKLGNRRSAASLGPRAWWKQMHLIKCHFHEVLRSKIQMKWKKFTAKLRSGSCLKREQRMKTKLSFLLPDAADAETHFNYPQFEAKGQGRVGGKLIEHRCRQHFTADTIAFYCGQQFPPSISFPFQRPDQQLHFTGISNSISRFVWQAMISTCARWNRRGKITSERNNQHNSSFQFIHISLARSLTHSLDGLKIYFFSHFSFLWILLRSW